MDLREASSTQRHPWELARFAAVVDIIAPHLRAGQRILDFGAGDAWFAHALQQRFAAHQLHIDCVDSATSATSASRTDEQHNPQLQQLTAIPGQQRYDVVLLLDVLEHLADDQATLTRIINDHTLPGAMVIVTVPAWPQLWSSHDVALHHHRRYTAATATALLQSTKLTLLASGGWFYSLLAPRLATVVYEKIRPPSAAWPHSRSNLGPWLARLASTVLYADARLGTALRRIVPWPGLSWWGVCQTPK